MFVSIRSVMQAGFVLVLSSVLFAVPAAAQMQQVLGIDAAGSDKPRAAFSVTVPQGWKSQGGVIWGNISMCNRYGYDISWAAMSADRRYGVALLPALRWTDSAQTGAQGCAVMQINSARDAVTRMVARLLPNAQLIDYRLRPDFIQQAGLKPDRFDLGYGAWMKSYVDAGEGLFSFTDDKGRPMRVTVGLIVNAFETFMPGGGLIPDMRFLQGETMPAWLAFAPAGELDMALAEQMRMSIQVNPDWQREIMRHKQVIDKDNRRTQVAINDINRKAHQDNQRTQAAISRINSDTNNYISRLNEDSFDKRMAAMDTGSQQFSDMMLERENWRDTDGTRLNAPAAGENMWRLESGDYVSTDNHNFNPLQSTGQFGTQLERWE